MRFLPQILFLFLASCSTKPSNELEQIGEDVLKDKSGRGLEIDVKPIPKEEKPKVSLNHRRVCSNENPPHPESPNPPGIEIIKVPLNNERT